MNIKYMVRCLVLLVTAVGITEGKLILPIKRVRYPSRSKHFVFGHWPGPSKFLSSKSMNDRLFPKLHDTAGPTSPFPEGPWVHEVPAVQKGHTASHCM